MKTSPFVIFLALMSVAELAHAAESAISVSIAVPALDPGKERSVVAFDRNSHFPVILTNTSKKPQRIITEWNSWGDHALSFELTDKSGKKSLAQRVSVNYDKNMPHWWILQPKESVVLDVYFADAGKWEGFPHRVRYGDSETVTMRAVFAFLPTDQKLSPDGLWTGRVFSAPEQIVFYNRMPDHHAGISDIPVRP
ncbi:MAG: hypothetical protein JWO95_3659 [Verrucomicrobiales bacterium]|nr:hypothetical protein [Verrucomicrobiales bacterium]